MIQVEGRVARAFSAGTCSAHASAMQSLRKLLNALLESSLWKTSSWVELMNDVAACAATSAPCGTPAPSGSGIK